MPAGWRSRLGRVMRTRAGLCATLCSLAAVTLVSGCGGNSSSAATSTVGGTGTASRAPSSSPAPDPTVAITPIDMCKLLPDADVKAATGLPIEGSVAMPRNSNTFVCTYFFGPVSLQRYQFDILFSYASSGSLDHLDRASFDAQQQTAHGVPVDGVGKAAFWAEQRAELAVWTGTGELTMSIQERLQQPQAPKAANPRAAALALAQEVLPKLPGA